VKLAIRELEKTVRYRESEIRGLNLKLEKAIESITRYKEQIAHEEEELKQIQEVLNMVKATTNELDEFEELVKEAK
jgi:chromosome segregation ATPase